MRARRPYLWLFLLLSAVYHSNLRPIASGDSFGAALIPFSLWLDGSVALDRFAPFANAHVPYAGSVLHDSGGHWYSAYPVGGPVLVSALYFPAALVPSLRSMQPEALIAIARVAEKLAAALLAAAAGVLMLLLLRRLTTERTAWWLTLAFSLGTNMWATCSQALWQHTFDQPAIILFLYAADRLSSRWFWILGLSVGIAIAIRPTNVVLVPAMLLVLWLGRARAGDFVRAGAPAAALAIAVAVYNASVFHRLSGGYPAHFGGHVLRGLAGILLSPGRGLLIYTPVVLFAAAAFLPGARGYLGKHRTSAAAAATIIGLQIALICRWPVWWGGYCWGPRLLVETLAPAFVLIAIGLPALSRRWRGAVLAAAAYGCLIQAVGSYCYPERHWDHLPESVDAHPERLWNWSDNPIVRTARGGVAWEPYSIVAAAVKGGIPAAAQRMRELGINAF